MAERHCRGEGYNYGRGWFLLSVACGLRGVLRLHGFAPGGKSGPARNRRKIRQKEDVT